MAVPAGMVAVMGLAAVIAMPGLAAEFGRTAADDIPHGFGMAGQDVFWVLLGIIGSVLAEDVRQGTHRIRMISLRMRVGSVRSGLMSWVYTIVVLGSVCPRYC